MTLIPWSILSAAMFSFHPRDRSLPELAVLDPETPPVIAEEAPLLPTWEGLNEEIKGKVLVVGDRGVEVFVDDEFKGTLPGYISMPEGIHFFTAIDGDGEECTIGRDIRFYQGGPPPVIHITCDS